MSKLERSPALLVAQPRFPSAWHMGMRAANCLASCCQNTPESQLARPRLELQYHQPHFPLSDLAPHHDTAFQILIESFDLDTTGDNDSKVRIDWAFEPWRSQRVGRLAICEGAMRVDKLLSQRNLRIVCSSSISYVLLWKLMPQCGKDRIHH
jgi:hypothetical protein